MLVTESDSNTSRARSWWIARSSSAGVIPSGGPVDSANSGLLDRLERDAVGRGDRDRVEERMLGRQQRAETRRRGGDPRGRGTGGHCAAEDCGRGPEVDTLRPGQHGIEHQHREKVRRRTTAGA